MTVTAHTVAVARERHRLNAEIRPGAGVPLVLMHGFPDNMHLYDRLLPHLADRRPVVRFDFLGWGGSDKPLDHQYTADNQVDDLAATIEAASTWVDTQRVVLVAHDSSGPPAIDWALAHPDRVERLVLLNTYYHWTPALRRPPAIALYSTPVLRSAARAVVRRRPDLDRRLYRWQVGKFIHDDELREPVVAQLYEQFPAARPAFWQLNDDLIGAVGRRRRRLAEMRRFERPVRIIFGARDRYLNARVARRFAAIFPDSELHLLADAGHFVQVDEPARVADLLLAG